MLTKKITFRIFSRIVLLIKYVSYLPVIDVIKFRSWCYKFILKKFKNNFPSSENPSPIIQTIEEAVPLFLASLLSRIYQPRFVHLT